MKSRRVLAHPPYKACADLGMSLNGNDSCDYHKMEIPLRFECQGGGRFQNCISMEL